MVIYGQVLVVLHGANKSTAEKVLLKSYSRFTY